MVGEAHLVGETNIFNVKYIIHEYGLPTICRPPSGGYLLGRYYIFPPGAGKCFLFTEVFFSEGPSAGRHEVRSKKPR